jgi:hypothetical protein
MEMLVDLHRTSMITIAKNQTNSKEENIAQGNTLQAKIEWTKQGIVEIKM